MVLAFLGATPFFTHAQTTPPLERGSVVSPVLTIDFERLFRESDYGRRVNAETDERRIELSAENREVEADLEAEELALTEQRSKLEPEAFRALADAFDQKVQETRATQAAKNRAINEDAERAQRDFLAAAVPVLDKLMRDAGAVVILELRSVFVSLTAVEITDDAIALLNDTLGSGAD